MAWISLEEAIQEDPDFVQWREHNPEVRKRHLVDQIALYRDFQNGRS